MKKKIFKQCPSLVGSLKGEGYRVQVEAYFIYIYERKTKNFKQLVGGETQRKIFRKRNIKEKGWKQRIIQKRLKKN